MANWADKEEKEALGAVSSLKRALGIANHPDKQDQFLDGHIHIYTPDAESAELIGELLYRYGNGKRAKYYDAHPERLTLRDTIKVEPVADGGYDVSVIIYHPSHFTRMLKRMVEKQIAPDKQFSR